MLKKIFEDCCQRYSKNENLIEKFWLEIKAAYNSPERYYHNLTHLENLISELNQCRNLIEDFDMILFSVFYHDIIYDTLKNNNEEKSAELAEKRMQEIGISDEKITRCVNHILATKSHIISKDNDTNLFTDADLSVLGKPKDVYEEYFLNIRKEYSQIPEIMYKTGRRKVLEHFLSMKKIYKTDYFFSKYELSARKNIEWELNYL